MEADIRGSILAEGDIALEGVERDGGVFPPSRVCQLKGFTAPAELVQINPKLCQEIAPLFRTLQMGDQG